MYPHLKRFDAVGHAGTHLSSGFRVRPRFLTVCAGFFYGLRSSRERGTTINQPVASSLAKQTDIRGPLTAASAAAYFLLTRSKKKLNIKQSLFNTATNTRR